MILGRNNIALCVFVLGTLLFLVSDTSGQRGLIREDYLALMPGVSTKGDVEKQFGSLEIVNFSTRAVTNGLIIIIDYSRGDCSTSPWRFPVWTVEEVTVFPKTNKQLTFNDVVLNKNKFLVRNNSDVLTMVEYYNEEFGVSIEYDKQLRRVESIRLRPTKEVREMFSCTRS